ncbi:uncharacterized protein [Temnothorax longispinosus]|uniref:uncharacterized protein n=1 Tax=Temnothorax longispinosus TaxID=300112 RepID=UPI003A9999BB
MENLNLIATFKDIEEILRKIEYKRNQYWEKRRDADLQRLIVRAGGGAAASVAAKKFMYYWKKGDIMPSNWRETIESYRPGDFNTHLGVTSWQPEPYDEYFNDWRYTPEFVVKSTPRQAVKKRASERKMWLAAEEELERRRRRRKQGVQCANCIGQPIQPFGDETIMVSQSAMRAAFISNCIT